MGKIKISSTIDINEIVPMRFCGETIGWEMKSDGLFTLPFEIVPTEGEHDFKSCDNCQSRMIQMIKNLTADYEGKSGKKAFPECCEFHSRLVNVRGFNKSDFDIAPTLTANKVIFTHQHILNNINSDDWFRDITEFIEWVAFSFGQMPEGKGAPLFLREYLFYVKDDLLNFKGHGKVKIKRLLNFLNGFERPDNSSKTDMNVLLDCYEKWFKIFPFELNEYFGDLKEYFGKKLPIFNGQPTVNRYSGHTVVKLHSKESLIEALVKLTEDLVTKLNGSVLFEKGLITDANRLKLDLILSNRRLKAKEGYINNSSTEEQRYRKILKEWLKDEKEFLGELIPLMKGIPPPNKAEAKGKLSVKQIALIHAYEGVQITRENASEIAANYGYKSTSSGEGLYQDYTFFCSSTNRKSRPHPFSNKKLNNRIDLINSVKLFLSEKSVKRAEDEVDILESFIED